MSRTITQQVHRFSKKRMYRLQIQNTIRSARQLRKYAFLFAFSLLLILSYTPLNAQPLVDTTTDLDLVETNSISVDGPYLNLTYYSNWNLTKTFVESGDRIEGDQIILNATSTPIDVVNKTRIEVNATALRTVISNEANASTVEIDTSLLNNNATCIINVTAWLCNGSVFHYEFENVFLGNFFRPTIALLTPIGEETWVGANNITWIASDENIDDVLTFEVLFSSDGGKSFQLLASGLSETLYTWDTTGFLNLSIYVIEVRVTDGIYTTWDRSGNFTAGNVPTITATTSTTPPPTTSTITPPPTNPDAITTVIIALTIVSSAFFALVAYFMAKSRL